MKMTLISHQQGEIATRQTGAATKGEQTMKYANLTNEELVSIIQSGDESGYDQLFRNLRPVMLHEIDMYRNKMDTYGVEDLIQECRIVAWEIISRGNFKSGVFSTYYGAAVRNHLIRIYRDYNLKNLVCIGESEDCRGNITRILVESDYAREYREKQRKRSKAWYEKKKAEQPPKEKKPPMTKEEKIARQVAWQKQYYATHPDKLAERREKNRIAEKARRERKKAAMMAAMATA